MSEKSESDNGSSHQKFQEWVEQIRDPAKHASEGRRVVSAANGKASAEYEIARLPDGRYATRVCCEYRCGNFRGQSQPWSVFESREQCLEHALQIARQHFEPTLSPTNCSDTQHEARRQILEVLKGGLYGFIEPEPET